MSKETISAETRTYPEARRDPKSNETTYLSKTASTDLSDIIEVTEKTQTREEGLAPQRIMFRSGSCLEIDRSRDEEVLRIIGSGGDVELRIRMADEGPVLCFEAASLNIQASNRVSVEGRHISLKASDGISMETSGDMFCEIGGDHISKVEGDVSSEARIQNIAARLGNVNVKANDDVKLNGERIMMNC